MKRRATPQGMDWRPIAAGIVALVAVLFLLWQVLPARRPQENSIDGAWVFDEEAFNAALAQVIGSDSSPQMTKFRDTVKGLIPSYRTLTLVFTADTLTYGQAGKAQPHPCHYFGTPPAEIMVVPTNPADGELVAVRFDHDHVFVKCRAHPGLEITFKHAP
jgi:hypothetical protein